MTKVWYNNMKITFKAYASNIYTQNGKIERFVRFIMEKVWAIRLSANLPYKLRREIVATVSYLYNCMLQTSIY